MSSVEAGVDHQTLSGYLAGVERAIKQALPEPEWLVAELSSFTVTGKGAVFLDLLESADGREVAKAKGVMFANVARRVLEQWRASTGGTVSYTHLPSPRDRTRSRMPSSA